MHHLDSGKEEEGNTSEESNHTISIPNVAGIVGLLTGDSDHGGSTGDDNARTGALSGVKDNQLSVDEYLATLADGHADDAFNLLVVLGNAVLALVSNVTEDHRGADEARLAGNRDVVCARSAHRLDSSARGDDGGDDWSNSGGHGGGYGRRYIHSRVDSRV